MSYPYKTKDFFGLLSFLTTPNRKQELKEIGYQINDELLYEMLMFEQLDNNNEKKERN